MNRTEFEQLQTEFAQQLYSYEQFCKLGYQLDAKFCYHFYENMEKEYKLMTENELMQKVIILLNDKKGLVEVEKCIQGYKQNYNKTIVSLNSKYNHSKGIINTLDTMEKENIDALEESFKEYVLNYHPAVKMLVAKQEGEFYNQLRRMYFENNSSGFKTLCELNKSYQQLYTIEEEKFVEYSQYYYKVMEQVKLDINKKKNIFPYTKEEVFTDEMTIASELADFKVKINRLSAMNKSLHKDIVDIYGEDINL